MTVRRLIWPLCSCAFCYFLLHLIHYKQIRIGGMSHIGRRLIWPLCSCVFCYFLLHLINFKQIRISGMSHIGKRLIWPLCSCAFFKWHHFNNSNVFLISQYLLNCRNIFFNNYDGEAFYLSTLYLRVLLFFITFNSL